MLAHFCAFISFLTKHILVVYKKCKGECIGQNSILSLSVYREEQLNVQSCAVLGDLFFAALLLLFRIAVAFLRSAHAPGMSRLCQQVSQLSGDHRLLGLVV